MADPTLIRRIKTSDGVEHQIDYESLANLPNTVTVTLYADNWDENTTYGRFYQDVVVVGVRKNDDTQIILADVALSGANGDIDADKVLLEAWGSISSQRVQQTMADTLRFYSMEEITVNVPVNIAIMQ